MADTRWAAIVVAGALRRRLRLPSEVFIDNRSIRLEQASTRALEDGVRRSAVFVVLTGPAVG